MQQAEIGLRHAAEEALQRQRRGTGEAASALGSHAESSRQATGATSQGHAASVQPVGLADAEAQTGLAGTGSGNSAGVAASAQAHDYGAASGDPASQQHPAAGCAEAAVQTDGEGVDPFEDADERLAAVQAEVQQLQVMGTASGCGISA